MISKMIIANVNSLFSPADINEPVIGIMNNRVE